MLVEVLECLLVRFRVGFLNGGLDGCLVDLVIVECFHLAFPRTTTVLLLFVTLDVLLAVLPATTHGDFPVFLLRSGGGPCDAGSYHHALMCASFRFAVALCLDLGYLA